MKKYETLDEIMLYIMQKHKFINTASSGAYGMLLLRKPDGRRLIVQEMQGLLNPQRMSTFFLQFSILKS
jgi:hypothetical protein